MRKSTKDSSNRGLQPRLSAFVLMIAGIILVFAFISRIDRFIEYITPYTAVNIEKNHVSGSGHRIISAIGAETEYQYKKSLTQSTNSREEITTPSTEEMEVELHPENMITEEKKVILPSRPGKGCKLSDLGELVAVKDCSPAEASALVVPADSHQRAIYKTGGATENRKISAQRYTLKKTDTLWGIAARTYGKGQYYTKILAANPGLRTDKLQVGKSIVLPEISAN